MKETCPDCDGERLKVDWSRGFPMFHRCPTCNATGEVEVENKPGFKVKHLLLIILGIIVLSIMCC